MNAFWEKYSEQFNARSIRERIIFTLCLLAALYFVLDFFLLSPQEKRREELDLRYEYIDKEMLKLSAEEKVLADGILNNPNAKKQREIVQLEARLADVDKQIQALSVGLIAAEKLPEVIRDLFLHRENLQLLGMQALEPERLRLEYLTDEEQTEEDVEDLPENNVGIFKHRVIFRMRGKYFDIMSYLHTLENSGWSFYWSEFNYVVDAYPYAIAQLEAYTLSTERGFISE